MFSLTHWGWVTHICVDKLTITVSDNGLSPGRRQAIIWTNARILLTGPLGTNCSEILIEIDTFSFKKIHLKTLSAKWRPFCLGLNVLIKMPFKWWYACCGHFGQMHLWICGSVFLVSPVPIGVGPWPVAMSAGLWCVRGWSLNVGMTWWNGTQHQMIRFLSVSLMCCLQWDNDVYLGISSIVGFDFQR